MVVNPGYRRRSNCWSDVTDWCYCQHGSPWNLSLEPPRGRGGLLQLRRKPATGKKAVLAAGRKRCALF